MNNLPNPPGPPCAPSSPPAQGPRLLDRVRHAIRARHYSRRTEKAYIGWTRRYIFFHGKRHPAEMGAAEVIQFLSNLAMRGRVGASTQNQAFSALLFLYRVVLARKLEGLEEAVRAKRPVRLPQVLSRDEVALVLRHLHGTPWLMASLMYGAGLRVLECARLRVKDVDFDRGEITVHDGKGRKDRRTLLPDKLIAPLRAHVDRTRQQYEHDLRGGIGCVELPDALAQKYPNAAWEWPWHWIFPAARLYTHSPTGQRLLAPQAGLRSWRMAALLVCIGLAYWATPLFQQLIGTVVYAMDSLFRGQRVASAVCFLGGPPSAPAWVGGAISAALAGTRVIATRNRAQGTNDGAA